MNIDYVTLADYQELHRVNMSLVDKIENLKLEIKRLKDDLVDFHMIIDHLTRTYDHFSRGRISKPNTLPEEVFSIADELINNEVQFRVNEQSKGLREEVEHLQKIYRELFEALQKGPAL